MTETPMSHGFCDGVTDLDRELAKIRERIPYPFLDKDTQRLLAVIEHYRSALQFEMREEFPEETMNRVMERLDTEAAAILRGEGEKE